MKKYLYLILLIHTLAFAIEKKMPSGAVVKDKPGQSQQAIVLDPMSMTNSQATKLGLKSYYHDTSYNSGNSPTVTLIGGGGSLSSIYRAEFIPRQMQDGSWILNLKIACLLSSATRTSATFAVNGIVAKNTTAFYQPITATNTDNALQMSAYATYNQNTVTAIHASTTTTSYFFNGDIELNAKPTWAY